jgi:MFS family permease
VAGLLILAAGLVGLAASVEMYVVMPSMFILGLGWNLAFVASTVVLADAARPSERAGLLGFNDFAAIGLGAPGVVLAAILLGEASLTSLGLVGAAIALTPLPLILARPRGRVLAGAHPPPRDA